MSYSQRETSPASASPIELYRWSHVDETYLYTSSAVARSYLSEDYVPAVIRRGNISQGEEINRSSIEVIVPHDHPVAALFSAGPPVARVFLRLYRVHSTDHDAEHATIWSGRVMSCEWAGAEAHIVHEPIWTSVRRDGLRRTWGLQCPHVLGSQGYGQCMVDLDDFDASATVVSVDGLTVTATGADAQPDGYWIGGSCVYVDAAAGRTYRAMIVGHSGEDITLLSPMPLEADDEIILYPGCDHSLDGTNGCSAKFDNALNFGGFPWTPQVSPHGGTTIY